MNVFQKIEQYGYKNKQKYMINGTKMMRKLMTQMFCMTIPFLIQYISQHKYAYKGTEINFMMI